MKLVHKKIFIILFLVFLLVALVILGAVFNKDEEIKPKKNIVLNTENIVLEAPAKDVPETKDTPKTENCVSDIKIEENIVNGNSLSGLIENGEKVLVYYGYYDCREVERSDMVIYGYAGNKEPLIKIIHGIPGDRFELKTSKNGWNIIINGEILKNSEGLNYNLSGSAYKMLHLYENDYQGIIPRNAYLLLGNLVSGTLDSTRFGLVGKGGILGKAIPVEN